MQPSPNLSAEEPPNSQKSNVQHPHFSLGEWKPGPAPDGQEEANEKRWTKRQPGRPAGPELTQHRGFGSLDPRCGGSWDTCSGRRSCLDPPASRSLPILSRARSPAGGTAGHRAEPGLGFRRVSQPCAPYLLGPGVIFCLDLKLAVLRVAAAGLGRRTPALPEPLLLLPLGHGSSGPRCGRRARAGSHAGPGAGKWEGAEAVGTYQQRGGGTGDASTRPRLRSCSCCCLQGLDPHVRTHSRRWRGRYPFRSFGELRGASGIGGLNSPPRSKWFRPPRPILSLMGCCLTRVCARGTHVARARLPALSRSARYPGLGLGLGAALELPGVAGSRDSELPICMSGARLRCPSAPQRSPGLGAGDAEGYDRRQRTKMLR